MINAEILLDILESDTFLGIVKKMDSEYVQRWRDSVSVKEREYFHIKQKVLSELMANLVSAIKKKAAEEKKAGDEGKFSAFLKRFNFNWRE